MPAPTDDPVPGAPRGVRTTRHRGRMTEGKRAVLVDLAPRWAIDPEGPWTAAHLAEVFGRTAPLRLDIGVGDGAATRAWAQAEPGADVIAVELHRPGVSRLLVDLDDDGPPNVRVAMADACAVLADLEPGAIDQLRVLFPDPWPKRRHVARRLVDRDFARQAASALRVGGTLHLATDWTEYADHMRTMVATEARLAPRPDDITDDVTDASGDGARWRSHRPTRPITAYERRGIEAGRIVTDLRWERVGPEA